MIKLNKILTALFVLLLNELSLSITLHAFNYVDWAKSSNNKIIRSNSNVFYVALSLRNVDKMKDKLIEISTPSHPDYGNFLSIDYISENFGPTPEDQNEVFNFFSAIKESKVELNLHHDMIRITASVENIETFLQTSLSLFNHKTNSHKYVMKASNPIVIPDNIATKIDFISLNTPILHFRKLSLLSNIRHDVSAVTANYNQPVYLAKYYGIPLGKTIPKRHGATQSLAEFYGEFYSNKDLSLLLTTFGLPNTSLPATNIFGDLPNVESSPGYEANLDVQYMMALTPGIPTYFYSNSGLNPYSDPYYQNEDFLQYLYVVGNQTDPPLVHSLSYGDIEATVFDHSRPGSIAYGYRVELEFVKMGLRGLTILFATGDSGIGNFQDSDIRCNQAWPDWPASSPYVTAVGGTQLQSGFANNCSYKTCGVEEVVCQSDKDGVITTGGGFSSVHNREHATWQEKVVTNYLRQKSKIPPKNKFNATGRGYPDISAFANYYYVYVNKSPALVAGTSASAPVVAAMVSLWNDLRLANGMSPLGFINPFLYSIQASNPEAFNDITSGNNACSPSGCCSFGFSAAPSWDAATGLGSPRFDVISKLVLQYGKPTQQPTTKPSKLPISKPTSKPTSQPTALPSRRPSTTPSWKPSKSPKKLD